MTPPARCVSFRPRAPTTPAGFAWWGYPCPERWRTLLYRGASPLVGNRHLAQTRSWTADWIAGRGVRALWRGRLALHFTLGASHVRPPCLPARRDRRIGPVQRGPGRVAR